MEFIERESEEQGRNRTEKDEEEDEEEEKQSSEEEKEQQNKPVRNRDLDFALHKKSVSASISLSKNDFKNLELPLSQNLELLPLSQSSGTNDEENEISRGTKRNYSEFINPSEAVPPNDWKLAAPTETFPTLTSIAKLSTYYVQKKLDFSSICLQDEKIANELIMTYCNLINEEIQKNFQGGNFQKELTLILVGTAQHAVEDPISAKLIKNQWLFFLNVFIKYYMLPHLSKLFPYRQLILQREELPDNVSFDSDIETQIIYSRKIISLLTFELECLPVTLLAFLTMFDGYKEQEPVHPRAIVNLFSTHFRRSILLTKDTADDSLIVLQIIRLLYRPFIARYVKNLILIGGNTLPYSIINRFRERDEQPIWFRSLIHIYYPWNHTFKDEEVQFLFSSAWKKLIPRRNRFFLNFPTFYDDVFKTKSRNLQSYKTNIVELLKSIFFITEMYQRLGGVLKTSQISQQSHTRVNKTQLNFLKSTSDILTCFLSGYVECQFHIFHSLYEEYRNSLVTNMTFTASEDLRNRKLTFEKLRLSELKRNEKSTQEQKYVGNIPQADELSQQSKDDIESTEETQKKQQMKEEETKKLQLLQKLNQESKSSFNPTEEDVSEDVPEGENATKTFLENLLQTQLASLNRKNLHKDTVESIFAKVTQEDQQRRILEAEVAKQQKNSILEILETSMENIFLPPLVMLTEPEAQKYNLKIFSAFMRNKFYSDKPITNQGVLKITQSSPPQFILPVHARELGDDNKSSETEDEIVPLYTENPQDDSASLEERKAGKEDDIELASQKLSYYLQTEPNLPFRKRIPLARGAQYLLTQPYFANGKLIPPNTPWMYLENRFLDQKSFNVPIEEKDVDEDIQKCIPNWVKKDQKKTAKTGWQELQNKWLQEESELLQMKAEDYEKSELFLARQKKVTEIAKQMGSTRILLPFGITPDRNAFMLKPITNIINVGETQFYLENFPLTIGYAISPKQLTSCAQNPFPFFALSVLFSEIKQKPELLINLLLNVKSPTDLEILFELPVCKPNQKQNKLPEKNDKKQQAMVLVSSLQKQSKKVATYLYPKDK